MLGAGSLHLGSCGLVPGVGGGGAVESATLGGGAPSRPSCDTGSSPADRFGRVPGGAGARRK